MVRRKLLRTHTNIEDARRQVVFWVALPAGVVTALLALLGALQSPNVINSLHLAFDTDHQAFVNHSLWWIICINITGALLTTAVIAWIVSLYFDYHSIKQLLAFARSKRKKERQQHQLLWTASALVAVPVILIIMWYAIGALLQSTILPATQTMTAGNTQDVVASYWRVTAPFFEGLILLVPFLVLIALYLLVKRRRL